MNTFRILSSFLIVSLFFLEASVIYSQDTSIVAKDTAREASSRKLTAQIGTYGLDTVFNPDSRIQTKRSSAVKDKSKEHKKEKYLLFSFGIGPATTRMDTLKDFDYLTFQASVGYWSESFVFPVTLSYTQTTNIYDAGTTYQRDLHLGTFVPMLASSKAFMGGGLGLGVSFGTTYEKSSSTGSVIKEDFVLPSLVLEGEIMLTPTKYMAIGFKGNIALNKKRNLASFMLSAILLSPL